MTNILAFLWFGLIGVAIIMYVILDGFDLGVGILSYLTLDDRERDLMISSILPVWDGNQTWLVFGGATLYGAFPLAFSVLLPALYMPILIMVCALLFRGVAFKFRLKSPEMKPIWDFSFFAGSILTAFIQGVMLGTFIQGFKVTADMVTIPALQWFTPFSIVCGIALVFGYMLLGANWLIIKTTGQLQQKAYRISKIAVITVGVFAALISLWSPLIDPAIKARWFNLDYIAYLALLPLATGIVFILHWMALLKKREYSPFFLAVVMFLLCYTGFVISSWPYIVPRSITYIQAAAPRSSLLFMLVGACIMLPILLYYTSHSYRFFRGKVTEVIDY